MTPATAKKSDRRPMTAKTFEVKTMNESLVTAKIAGILSTAKMRSVNSTTISTRKRGVKYRMPFWVMLNLS